MIRKDQAAELERQMGQHYRGSTQNPLDHERDETDTKGDALCLWDPEDFFARAQRGEIQPGLYLFIVKGVKKP